MNISFVILTWNSADHIKRCIQSISESLSASMRPYEIFIVDNGSIDETVMILEGYQSKYPEIIKPIFLEKNTGTTYSRNLALKQATGKYVAVIDSDVEIFPGVIEKLIAVLDKNSRNGMAVPKLVYSNGNLQKSTDNFPTFFSKLYRYFFLKCIEKKEEKTEKNAISPVDYAISAFWMIKSDTIVDVGLLDENIFYAPEDVDYCLRVWKKGYRILYVPEISSVHQAQEISRGFRLNKATIEHVKGLLYFFWKHRYWLSKPRFDNVF